MVPQHIYAVLLLFGCLASLISLRDKQENVRDFFSDDLNESRSGLGDHGILNAKELYEYERFFVRNASSVTNDEKTRNVYIQGLFEIETKGGTRWEGNSELKAAELAVRHVNQYRILPGFMLNLLKNDTKCDPGVGLDRFFHALYSNKTITMLLAGTCSNVTETLANVVPYWNILQVSYGSVSPVLSDRKKFPLFFRTVAVASSHNAARISFIRNFNWETVVMFSESEEDYLLALNNFVTELESKNISCVATITFSLENLKEQLQILKDLDVRIIVGSFSPEVAQKVFCEAFELQMLGTEYVWILQDENVKWWENPKACERRHLLVAADGTFFVTDYNTLAENVTSVYGLTNEDFKSQLVALNTSVSKYAPLAYDAVWSMAFALREAMGHSNGSLNDFTYKNRGMTWSFLEIMKNMRFMGISGPVIFKGADRIGNTIFKQLQRGQIHDVVLFDPLDGELDFNCKGCKEIRWKGDQVPVARRILKKLLVTIPKAAFYTISMVSSLGIVCSAIFLYFNLHFRRMRTVKLSSPHMNNIAIIGCITVYVAVTLLGIDSSYLPSKEGFSYLCMIRVYLLSAGFSLTFGSLFAKTYRVHRIFTYRRTSFIKDKLLKDKLLIVLVCLLLLIDGLIITLWSLVDPMHYTLLDLPIELSTTNKGVAYQPQVETCRSENTLGWFIAMYGYKGILLMMVVYMAWETRRVKIPELNDSQYIGICVYSVLSSTLVVIISNSIPNHPTISYLTTATSILASTTIIVILLFLPKLKSILARSESQDPIEKCMGLKTEFNTRRFLIDDPKDLIYRLEAQNKVYKNELQKMDKEIAHLEEQLAIASRQSSFGPFHAKSQHVGVSIIGAGGARASWPTEFQHDSQGPQGFISNLDVEESSGSRIIKQMKKIFGSITSVWHFNADQCGPDMSIPEVEEFRRFTSSTANGEEEKWFFNVKSAVQYSYRKPDSGRPENDRGIEESAHYERY